MELLTGLTRMLWVAFANGGWFFVVAIIALTGGPRP